MRESKAQNTRRQQRCSLIMYRSAVQELRRLTKCSAIWLWILRRRPLRTKKKAKRPQFLNLSNFWNSLNSLHRKARLKLNRVFWTSRVSKLQNPGKNKLLLCLTWKISRNYHKTKISLAGPLIFDKFSRSPLEQKRNWPKHQFLNALRSKIICLTSRYSSPLKGATQEILCELI